MNRLKTVLVTGIAMLSLTLVASVQATAVPDQNLADIGTALGSASQPTLLTQVASIIKLIISFLGVISLIMVIYAGFLWMTSGGENTKADKAKKLMINGAIGLLIILSAYSITTFVFNELVNATTTTV